MIMATPFYFPIPKHAPKKSNIVYDCDKCGLCDNDKIKHPKMHATISWKTYKGLMVIGSSISSFEDNKGKLFSTGKGKLLRRVFRNRKMKLSKIACILPALPCKKKKPYTKTEMRCCLPILRQRINKTKPRLIIACGEEAANMLLPTDNKVGITKLRGRLIPLHEYNCLMYVTFDPNKMDGYGVFHYYDSFKKDINRIANLWERKLYKRTIINKILKERRILDGIRINRLDTEHEVDQAFETFNNAEQITIDYETNGLFPYEDVFHVRYVGFAIGKQAWWLHIPSLIVRHGDEWFEKFKRQMQELLANENVIKIAQNVKYEDLCSKYYFDSPEIIGQADPMLATHVIDQRRGCTSLDFQNLVRFGIPEYSGLVKYYLTTLESEDSRTNRIDEAPIEDVGHYLGLDVITTWFNWIILDERLLNAWDRARWCYEFLLDGHWVFSWMTHRGITVDLDEMETLEEDVADAIVDIELEIGDLPEVKEFEETL
jgi:uracil-DNA glycosylase family 4